MEAKAILFDFDNTIADTTSIREIRETLAYDKLTVENLARVRAYKPVPHLLRALKRAGAHIGLVTNAGRGYLTPVLHHLHLDDVFDVVVTYTDVKAEGKKPSPKGILRALDALGIAPGPEVLYVGDEDTDHQAAYRAGITPIMPSWATRKSVSTPPAMEMNSEQLIEYLSNPLEFRLFAEQCAERGTANFARRGVYFLPLDSSANIVTLKEQMTALCLGRYFSQKGAVTAWLHSKHPLSCEIQSKEEVDTFSIPEHWYGMLAHVVEHGPKYIYDDESSRFDLVTVIPAKKGKDPRLERLLDGLGKRLKGDRLPPEFATDLLYYLDDARSQKTLRRAERSFEAQRALHLNLERARLISGKRVLVIDDVTTTGATLARAEALLVGAGAKDVVGVAIAKTVSIMEDERACPHCARPMRVKRNGNTGEHFFGCTGFHDPLDPCNHTEALVKKVCPNCQRDMRVQTVKATGQKFWSCTGWRETPTCNHSMDFDESEIQF
ncbi:HAD-IA family hydrolase [Bordetella trematum]|uniref:HAD-IA family hydrolase n=1 Tax=Bordetella trematum TaxID=123899 RepID=UPI000D990AD2|nr:HAD-IA family hydrolase [Bordetella trematum]SPU50451.1 Phosphoglycolate phosphatase [Bordetella trematum]VDH06688.1 Phosphoglycolate phosphatase [Bordetella trematum]